MNGYHIAFAESVENMTLHNEESSITCPMCSFTKTEIMPTDSCLFFWKCENCKAVLKPLPGDCCVYCSYGSAQCPPKTNVESCLLATRKDYLSFSSRRNCFSKNLATPF